MRQHRAKPEKEGVETMYTVSPTRLAKKMLLGTMMGDASIAWKLETCTSKVARLIFHHSWKQLDYFIWKMQFMYPLVGSFNVMIDDKLKTIMGVSISSTYLKHIFDDFYHIYQDEENLEKIRKVKVVSMNVLRRLTPLSLAVWYMDDGCLKRNKTFCAGIRLATCSFTGEEHETLEKYFNETWNLDVRSECMGSGWLYLRMNKESANRFLDLIYPYVPAGMFDYKFNSTVYKSAEHVITHEEIVQTLQQCGELIRNNQPDTKNIMRINWSQWVKGPKANNALQMRIKDISLNKPINLLGNGMTKSLM